MSMSTLSDRLPLHHVQLDRSTPMHVASDRLRQLESTLRSLGHERQAADAALEQAIANAVAARPVPVVRATASLSEMAVLCAAFAAPLVVLIASLPFSLAAAACLAAAVIGSIPVLRRGGPIPMASIPMLALISSLMMGIGWTVHDMRPNLGPAVDIALAALTFAALAGCIAAGVMGLSRARPLASGEWFLASSAVLVGCTCLAIP
jgi:hypothetical protein